LHLHTFSVKRPTEEKILVAKIYRLVMELSMKKCKQCEKEFQPKDELDLFCGQDCKEEALAELDSGSDECLSCQ
jgi:hypothetical protein